MRSETLVLASLSIVVATTAGAQARPTGQITPRSVAMLASVDTALFRGLKFRVVGPPRGGRVTTVTGVPSQPHTFYMGVARGGVFQTTYGGKTWRKALYLSDSTGAAEVELNPTNPDIVYAWMWHGQRKPWTIISGAREGGFYKSTDGGEHFTKITNGLPTELI